MSKKLTNPTEYRQLRKEYELLLGKIRSTSNPREREKMILEIDLLRTRMRRMKYPPK